MADRNQVEFEEEGSVALYARSDGLQLPEETILGRLRSSLPQMDMLDLGVGSGRTTPHFAPLARSYLGIDYSSAMIRHCRETFPQYAFQVGDARSLKSASAEVYDLVLFSYNGIDYVGADDRRETLLGIKRILRPGGLFVFSTHNANFLPSIVDRYRFRLKSTVRETLRSLKWSMVFAARNRTLRFPLPYSEGFVADGFNSFRSQGVYYVRPDLQIAALRRLGMTDISCAGNDSGEFMDEGDLRIASIASPWVYFVCCKSREAARD